MLVNTHTTNYRLPNVLIERRAPVLDVFTPRATSPDGEAFVAAWERHLGLSPRPKDMLSEGVKLERGWGQILSVNDVNLLTATPERWRNPKCCLLVMSTTVTTVHAML